MSRRHREHEPPATPSSVSVRRPSELGVVVFAGPDPSTVLRAAADWIDTHQLEVTDLTWHPHRPPAEHTIAIYFHP